MTIVAKILVRIVAIEHLIIFWIEAVAWETRGPKVFSTLPQSLFSQTKAIAANMGPYNELLAAGLIWSLIIKDPIWSWNVSVFFVSCVIVAAVYGALTAYKIKRVYHLWHKLTCLMWIAARRRVCQRLKLKAGDRLKLYLI